MKKVLLPILAFIALSCSQPSTTTENATAAEAPGAGQSAVKDDTSEPDVVRVAVGSADHTTLVTALKTAEYVDALSNAGPFTVFAPTNAAFDKPAVRLKVY
jgi:uncharacterized surface protein with fasciclin (FAS1) repeats